MDRNARRAAVNHGFDGDWRVCRRWEHVYRAEKIEWCCKQTGEVQVISEDLILAGRILGLSEKNQCLCSVAVGE